MIVDKTMMLALTTFDSTLALRHELAIFDSMTSKKTMKAKFLFANMGKTQLHINQSKLRTSPDEMILGAKRTGWGRTLSWHTLIRRARHFSFPVSGCRLSFSSSEQDLTILITPLLGILMTGLRDNVAMGVVSGLLQ